ncbi:TetR/AcrR family transcriptional regulator [Pontibacter anaerobius]|uniref:TetR/AcrR family transcriptional regulator n=1 Tax=Pontibacter anaerobius TaxID=2993940 RepID=A0ABT3RBS6_9BACT|nr:TetR/AcrR family transcriptional regulator [Pontibacter anaerobius]MCX2739316.1 TetR/AcrR family transcriptional regulator [Pontibacter anaerobius]
MEPIADKKRAIFESMLELVKEKGFHGTPMSMVAKRAGVAAGTIYHYFDSKEKLICELYHYIQQQVIEIVKHEDCTDISFKECFFNLWYALFTYYTEKPSILRFFEQFVNSPYNTNKDEFGKDEFHRLLFRFFERGIKEGHLRPVSPKILGTLAHSNIISTVKIQASGRLTLQDGELEQIPLILWDGMRNR